MIDTNTRDPERTWRDIHALIHQAKSENYVPLSWRLGFFCARDLLVQHVPGWKERRAEKNAWVELRELCGLPAEVVELEDRVQLVAAFEIRPGIGDCYRTKVFTIDRRATGD